MEKSEKQTPVQDQRCQSGPSAKSSVIPSAGDSFKNYGADQPATFGCWKIRFKTEVCTCSQFPSEAMHLIKEVEMVDSVDDLISSSPVREIQMPNLEVLDANFEVFEARIPSALN